MCGYAGFYLNRKKTSHDEMEKTITKMANSLEHRGPDDLGIWLDSNKPIAFGHRRLSIVDISASGHQPMMSANKKYVIALNGEIYNHTKLRKELNLLNSNCNSLDNCPYGIYLTFTSSWTSAKINIPSPSLLRSVM